MIEKNKNKDKKVSFINPYNISIIAFIFLGYMYIYKQSFNIKEDELGSIINLFVTFSSITVGFVGTLLGLILSISDSYLIVNIKNNDEYSKFINAMKHNIYAGLYVVFLAFFVFLDRLFIDVFNRIILSLVLSLFVFLILSTVRSTRLIVKMILNKDKGKKKLNVLDPSKDNMKSVVKNLKK